MWLKLFIACGVCAAFNVATARAQTRTVAQAPAPSGGNSGWVRAQVVTDGAAVYAKPDFDSAVQDYLPYQTQANVSRKPYAGTGGLGLFHRISYRNKVGYITDTDIRVTKREAEKQITDEKKKAPSKAWSKEDEEALGKAPIYLTRFVGGALAMVNFTEKYSGRKLSDNMMMYGLRMTGPGVLFDGPPLELNVWFSLQKPKYFNQFASGSPSGFLLFGDLMAMLPLVNLDKTVVNYGLGVMWTYTKYSIPVRNVKTGDVGSFDSQEFRMGAALDLGIGQRFGRYLLRGDVKYYIEKTTYPGYVLSFQMEY